MSRRSLMLLLALTAALALAAPAFAGHSTYYKIKGGSQAYNITAANTLKSHYGISLNENVRGGGADALKLSLKKGGKVYQSRNSMLADSPKAQTITIKYDTRGANGRKAGVTTVKIKRLSLTIGKTTSFLIGNVSGSSTVAGVSVKGGEYRIFNIGGGKVKKSKSKKYKYSFKSNDLKFNSQLTNLLNTFGTPRGSKKASAKIDLGSVSVKVK